jgi:hypothetical protein
MDLSDGKNTSEITITGKPNASGADRAVLSAVGSKAGVLAINDGIKVRLEHIEISGGERDADKNGEGIYLTGEGTRLTLGAGAIVRRNQYIGIRIQNDASCILDGGEIRENNNTGVAVLSGGVFTMRSGSIRDNKTTGNAGGVFVDEGGVFTMSGGAITGNSSEMAGGGVCVMSGGTFNQTGGTISNNTAKQGSNPNIYRESGALGTNLSSSASSSTPPPSSSSGSSGSSGSTGSMGAADTAPPRSAPRQEIDGFFEDPVFAYDWGVFFEAGALSNINKQPIWMFKTVTAGVGLQLGLGATILGIPMDFMAEAGVNLNVPGGLGYHFGGAWEFYPFDDDFGFSLGIGQKGLSIGQDLYKPFTYIRLGLALRSDEENNVTVYFSFFPKNGWTLGFSWF